MSVITAIILAAVIVGVVVAASTTASAFLMAYMTNKQRRAEIIDDRGHDDVIAEIAAQQMHRLIDTNVRIADRTSEAADRLEGKLNVIHTLVNSGLTEAKQSELDAVTHELDALKKIAALNNRLGRPADASTSAAIAETERRHAELEKELVIRRANDEATRIQAAAADDELRGG